jgi:signal transduction histidine kinase
MDGTDTGADRTPLVGDGAPSDGDDRPTQLGRLAWPLAAVWLLVWLASLALVIANRSAMRSFDQADPVDVILPVGFAVIGTLLASRTPRNPIGWIFLGIAVIGALSGVVTMYVFRDSHFGPLPFTAWVAWIHDPLNWVVFPAGLATFFFLLFPDGHLPSSRWRWFAWFTASILGLGFVFYLFQDTISLNGVRPIPNPLGSVAVVSMENGAPGLIWLVALGVLLTAMVGIIVRTRRSTGELRQQLRWLAFASALTAAALVVMVGSFVVGLTPPDGVFDAIIVLGFGVAVPVSCGVAILKYGLYELDVVISKTVAYAGLAAFFTAVYLAIVVGIGTAIGSSNSSFLTVLAAATIAVAFNPVRDRAKRFANRIVYGERASPYEVLSEFSERVAGTYSVEDVLPRMATLLGRGTGAHDATVWLRVGAELRPAASWDPNGSEPAAIPMPGGELPDIAGASKVAAVRDRDELLGALTVAKPPNDPLTVAEGKLVDDLAAQAGLVLRNVRLTEELRANLEELRASRQRLVAAQDGERRRIERNIHDGAQQQLVALAVQIKMAESFAGKDTDREREVLRRAQAGIHDALEDLRDLARGIYPPLLADQGLAAALEAQARRSTVPVAVQAEGIARYAQEAEAAVYFCVLEALQNVGKYAEASRATVRLWGSAEELRFEVADDGRGFDPAATGYGTGVQGMVDRLAALGGELGVESTPGSGTTIAGTLPLKH